MDVCSSSHHWAAVSRIRSMKRFEQLHLCYNIWNLLLLFITCDIFNMFDTIFLGFFSVYI